MSGRAVRARRNNTRSGRRTSTVWVHSRMKPRRCDGIGSPPNRDTSKRNTALQQGTWKAGGQRRTKPRRARGFSRPQHRIMLRRNTSWAYWIYMIGGRRLTAPSRSCGSAAPRNRAIGRRNSALDWHTFSCASRQRQCLRVVSTRRRTRARRCTVSRRFHVCRWQRRSGGRSAGARVVAPRRGTPR